MFRRTKALNAGKQVGDGRMASWVSTEGVWLAVRNVMDEVARVADGVEAKWGAGRARMVVGLDLRQRVDRQRALYQHALWHGPLADLQREGGRMVNAWLALGREADRLQAEGRAAPTLPEVWEIALGEPGGELGAEPLGGADRDGRVVALVRRTCDMEAALMRYEADDRYVDVWSLEEVAELIRVAPQLVAIKASFPGALVSSVRAPAADPVDRLTLERPLDDPIPF